MYIYIYIYLCTACIKHTNLHNYQQLKGVLAKLVIT